MELERYDAPLRERVIELVEQTRKRSGWPVKRTLQALGIAPSSYFAWSGRPVTAD